MALKESEAIVLRTYPLRESDLLVTLFTRMEGKVKGVARAAMKSRRRFGGALEPLTYVRAFYDDREGQELARLDSCEVIESPLASEVGYSRAVALAHVAELLDELMPDREASDAVFRLSLAVLQELRGEALWMPLTYFELWMTRLMGFLPEFSECVVCGRRLMTRDAAAAAGRSITRSPTAWFAWTTSAWRRRSCRRNREGLRPRCCARVFPSLQKLTGRKRCARICANFFSRFWSGTSRRSW